MTTVKFTTPTAAGNEVDRLAARYAAETKCDYADAVRIVLDSNPELAQAYAQPAAGVSARPAVPVSDGEEREIRDWIMRALEANMAGSLPGALGLLAIESDNFRKIGMPAEEATRRAMAGNAHLLAMAKLLLADIRRNEAKPVADGETAAAQTPGETAHLRAQALVDKDPDLSYTTALHQVLDEDPALKSSYART